MFGSVRNGKEKWYPMTFKKSNRFISPTSIVRHINVSATLNWSLRKEGNVLFNDELITFYLLLYGVGHNMVKDHTDSERGNPLLPL